MVLKVVIYYIILWIFWSSGHIGIFPKGVPYEFSPKFKKTLFRLLLDKLRLEIMLHHHLVKNRAFLDYRKTIFCDMSRRQYVHFLIWQVVVFQKRLPNKIAFACFAMSDKINYWNIKTSGGIFYFWVRTGKFIYIVVNHKHQPAQSTDHLNIKTLRL